MPKVYDLNLNTEKAPFLEIYLIFNEVNLPTLLLYVSMLL